MSSMRPLLTLAAIGYATLAISSANSADLTWDHNADSTASDGSGTWLNANQWLDGGSPATWNNGTPDNAIIGSGGAGGTITLGAVTAGTVLLDNFTGTYRLNGGSLDQSGGITVGTTAGNVEVFTAVSGAGGITINGPSRVNLRGGGNNTFSGNLVVTGGGEALDDDFVNIGTGNLTLNGGSYVNYWSDTLTRTLGSGPGQVQILGGDSGFTGQGNFGLTVRLNNNASSEVVWGSTHFDPSTLVLQTPWANTNGKVNFQNRIDLNGVTRTIAVNKDNEAPGGWALLSGVIRDGTGGSAGLIKTGVGLLRLSAANEFTGGVEINNGTIRLENNGGLGIGGPLNFTGSGTKLDLRASPTVGALSGTGTNGLITAGAAGTRTLTVDQASDTTFGGVIENGVGTVALTKTGTGVLALSGNNTYTGNTLVNNGTLLVHGTHTGGGQYTVASGGTLGGNGSITAGVDLSGTLSPGASIGTFSTGSETWNDGGNFLFEIDDATGTAGGTPGWDLLAITGTLDLTGLSSSGFTIDIVSLQSGGGTTPGLIDNFDGSQKYLWEFVTTTGGVIGFDANQFSLNDSGFSNPFGGWFAITQTANGLAIAYVPEPEAFALGLIGLLAVAVLVWRRRS